MKRIILFSSLLALTEASFALPSPGEFIASRCGKAAYGPTASVEVCFGSIMGAPATIESDGIKRLVYFRVGGSNYVGEWTPAKSDSPTQPLPQDTVDLQFPVAQLAPGEISPRDDAKSLEVHAFVRGDTILSAEITLNNGKILKVESFYIVGGAR